jgi:hypothetical protein
VLFFGLWKPFAEDQSAVLGKACFGYEKGHDLNESGGSSARTQNTVGKVLSERRTRPASRWKGSHFRSPKAPFGVPCPHVRAPFGKGVPHFSSVFLAVVCVLTEPFLPVSNGLMGKHKASLQKQFRNVTQAQFLSQAPQDDK